MNEKHGWKENWRGRNMPVHWRKTESLEWNWRMELEQRPGQRETWKVLRIISVTL